MAGTDAEALIDERADPVAPEKASPYAWYIAWMLLLVTLISMLDRKALVILAEPIKRDLHLSDTEIGLLTGGMFSLVYAISSFPLARIADRFSRPKLIAYCMVVWSALTAMGGMANSFWFLAFSRVGVAVGEAGASPASHSLLASYFPPSSRGRALSILMAGAPLGIFAGLAIAGWLSDLHDWRTALFVVGAPGVLVALVILFTIKEVDRPAVTAESRQRDSLINITKHVLKDDVLRNLTFGVSLHFVAAGGINAFTAAFIMRRFGLGAAEVGLSYGAIIGLAGVTGALAGGWITDKLGLRDSSAALRMYFWMLILSAAIVYFMYSVEVFWIMLGLVSAKALLSNLYVGPTFTTLQARVGDGQRATATAVMLFAINGIGASLGPLLVGAVSDLLAAGGAANWETLRIGLLALVPFELAAAYFYFRSGRHLKRSVDLHAD